MREVWVRGEEGYTSFVALNCKAPMVSGRVRPTQRLIMGAVAGDLAEDLAQELANYGRWASEEQLARLGYEVWSWRWNRTSSRLRRGEPAHEEGTDLHGV